jgi:medium-chain acyl-[acyl-carrier-protein] hydrolase
MIEQKRMNPWFVCPAASPSAQLRLFCFPYAGGSAASFHKWGYFLGPKVEVCSIQYPGRATRLSDPPIRAISSIIEEIAEGIDALLDKPFALFGHSMGAIIAFETAHKLREAKGLIPHHLFVSASRAPHLAITDRYTFDLPEAQFIGELRRLRGTPVEVLESADLLTRVMPALRADFELIQTYRYSLRPPLSCPMTAMCGCEDGHVSRLQAQAWQGHCCNNFLLRMFPGDHFFLHSAQRSLLQSIAVDLLQTGLMPQVQGVAPSV